MTSTQEVISTERWRREERQINKETEAIRQKNPRNQTLL